MNIGIAAFFVHHPEVDGPSIIQGSEVVQREDDDEYRRHASPDRPDVFPKGGFVAYTTGSGRTLWGFVKYEAPQMWHPSYHFQNRPCSLATCRFGDLSCRECGWSGPYPLKGDRMPCPMCGRKGVSASPIREGGDRYFEMLDATGMRDELEQAARDALASPDPEPFRFPMVVLGGPDVTPSPDVPPSVQGAAQSKGLSLAPLSSVKALGELSAMDPGSHMLGIVPGVSSGVMDAAEAKAGKSWSEGIVQSWVRLWVPEPPKGPVRFCGGTCF